MSSMELYQVGGTEKIRNLEEGLAKELTDLQNDIEENDMIGGSHKTASSCSLPKSIDHFRKQRELVIKRAMEVSEALPLVMQADVMKEEMEISLQKEYTEESLPLILHQHFCDRIQQLVQCKHMHMLRWKRFCEHTSALEALYAPYQKRLAEIMAEYSDTSARARRLSIAHEAYLMGKVPAHNQVTEEDLMIYMRWLTCHLHSTKKIHAYLRILEWLPVSHKHESLPPPHHQHIRDAEKGEEGNDDQNLMASGTIPNPSPRIIQSQGRWSIFDGRMSLTDPMGTLSSMGRGSLMTDQFRQSSPLVEQSESDGASDTASIMSSSVNMGGTNTVPHTARAIAAAAAAGGGPASNSDTLGIPCHVTDLDHLRPQLEFLMSCYGIHANLDRINGPSDEMELLSYVNRRFKTAFARQEEQKTFPTYDKLEMGNESWGADVSNHALIKESNWLPFIKLKARRDPVQEKMMTKLRHIGNVDELLRAQSRFFSVNDINKVQDALKEHAIAVRDPPAVQAVSVTSHRTSLDTKNVWRQIYSSPDLYSSSGPADDIAITDFDEKDVDNINLSSGSRSGSALASSRRRRKEETDEYDYTSALQLLGLEEDDSSQQDPAMVQGGYLAFLQLRHLKIRDLQRTCLGILNYFRSVERTLTINDGGLSLEGKQQKRNSKQNHKQGVNDGGLGGGGGLGSHGYLHYTPSEFRLGESEFLEFSEVENHDDFYSLDEGRVHVQDQRGYYVIYQAAMEDFKQLEKDLLLVATCFIERDRENRFGKIGLSKSSSQGRRKQAASDMDLPSYGHQQVDRFAVLLDLWSNEAAFLENKRQLLDVYLEAYQHVFDMHEKRSLAQVITNITYQRPRFDLKAEYFVRTYRAECHCLRLHCALIKSVLDQQISDQREYIQKVCRDGEEHQIGKPFRIIPKQPVSINISRSALQCVYLLEFHPSLALASRVPQALTQAFNELVHAHQPRSVTESILIEKKILEIAQREWEHLQPVGSTFSNQIQRDLFSEVYAEDPTFMCEIAQSVMASLDAAAGRRTPKERKADLLKIWSRLLETITLRHRLIETANETELLSKLYKDQAADMGFDLCHLFLRCVQFEFASHKENADQPPPLFITALHEDDTNVDRYVPSSLFLAIHELDEKHVGQLSFRTKDGFLKLMTGSSLENLQAVLMAQVVHKNALLAAVQQGSVCSFFKEDGPDNGPKTSGMKSPQNAGSDRTNVLLASQNAATPMATATSVIFAAKLKSSMESHKRSPESFVSLQLEKTPSRDVMLNTYLTKKANLGTIMKNPDEVEKLKRGLIVDFCRRFMRRMTQYSLRGQLIAYLNSILFLLENFPSIRNGCFVVGLPNEKKTAMDDKKGLVTNPRDLKKRPRRLLSSDGSTLLNLWFLPHHTEVLHMFKTLDEDTCARALSQSLRIVASLHDILQYLCAHSKLGSSNARLGSGKQEFVTADWGGTEGISAELREIQKQVNHLDNPTDPQEVADFLSLRRDVLFLEYDATMRHSLRETFLSMGNHLAYHSSSDSIYFALTGLSNVQMSSVFGAYLPVPEPLQPRDWKAQELFPWRAHLGRRGPFPLRFWQWQQIELNMQLSMSALRDVDRHVAHGEILGVSLLMEDVLQSGQQDISMVPDDSDDEDDNLKATGTAAQGKKSPARSRPRSAASAKSASSRPGSSTAKESGQEVILKKSLSRTTEPIKAYSLLKDFLLLWKRLEVFKAEWGQRKLGQEEINTPTLYRKFCKLYKTDILYPVIRIIAKRYGEAELYEGMVSDSEPIVAPRGASEMEIRAKQLVKLLDSLENHMIYELRRKVAREHSLVLAERSREEGNLPTDLWKKPAINERFTFAKPQIAEDFAWYLMEVGQRRDEEKALLLTDDQLNVALSMLATTIMARERTNYENYSMFYENLLRQHHQLLYQREREIEQLKKACKDATASALVEVQCQLADRSHELILEITALRAKVAEMRELSMTQERDLREKMQEEYDTLVQSLFQGAFGLKVKFDEFGVRLYDEAFSIVGEVRREAMEAMKKFTPRTAEKDESGITLNERRAVDLQTLRHENNNLSRLLLKMKALTNWRLTNMRQHYKGTSDALQHEVDRCKREYLAIKMTAEEEVILLRQQLMALRKALATSDKERETVQKQLDKEMRIKQERQHKLEQEARSARQLEAARIANLERMMDEIDDKELRLRILSEEYDRTLRLYQTTQEKARKEVHQIKNRLDHERSLKLDAFQRVDELQTQVYDYEAAVSSLSRPYTAMTMRSKSRATTADKRPKSHRATSSMSTSTGAWPPSTIMPPNYQQRSVTPDPWPPVANNERGDRITQRPKTVGTRLRNRIADQLLTNLEPNHHETIMHLQAEEQQYQKYKL